MIAPAPPTPFEMQRVSATVARAMLAFSWLLLQHPFHITRTSPSPKWSRWLVIVNSTSFGITQETHFRICLWGKWEIYLRREDTIPWWIGWHHPKRWGPRLNKKGRKPGKHWHSPFSDSWSLCCEGALAAMSHPGMDCSFKPHDITNPSSLGSSC